MKKDKLLIEKLKTVIDPELHENIVDIGLIYGAEIVGEETKVTMTLTTPFCPMAPQIEQDIKNALLHGDNKQKVIIDLVWEPVWSSDMMCDELKDKFGLW